MRKIEVDFQAEDWPEKLIEAYHCKKIEDLDRLNIYKTEIPAKEKLQ